MRRLGSNASARQKWARHAGSAALCLFLGSLAVTETSDTTYAQEADNKRAIIVFDASGSMWGQISGENKIVSARRAVSEALQRFPNTVDLGLMAYGHNRKGDCSDIELLVPPDSVEATRATIISSVNSINPRGKTPLSDAVRLAAEELKYTEEEATVILITDGLETCEADPCALANQLEQTGVGFTAHVVGFGLTEEERQQIQCLPQNTGGQYFQADDAEGLADALQQTIETEEVAVIVPPPPEPEPERVRRNLLATVSIGENTPPFERDSRMRFDWSIEPLEPLSDPEAQLRPVSGPTLHDFFPEGRFRLTASNKYGVEASTDITLSETEVTNVNIALNAGMIDLFGVMINTDFDGFTGGFFNWEITNLDTDESFQVGGKDIRAVIPAGRYEAQLIVARRPKMSPPNLPFTVTAGQVTEGEVIGPHSRVVLRAFNEDGSEMTDFDLRHQVYLGDVDGQNLVQARGGDDPYFLLPGRYTVRLEAWDGSKREPITGTIEVGSGEDRVFRFTYPAAPQ